MFSWDLEKKALSSLVDERYEVAIDLYKAAIVEDPGNADLYADCAQANLKLGNYKEAVADADRAILLDASFDKAYLRRGNANFKLGNSLEALGDFVMGFGLARNDVRFLARIGECQNQLAEQLKQQKGAEAFADADRAILLDASLDKAYLRRGNANFKLGNYLEALGDFVMGFGLARNDMRFLARIGECQNQLAEQLKQQQGADYRFTVDNASTDSDSEENIFTVDHSSIGFEDDKPTGDELGDDALEGRDDVTFDPFTPEIETATMETLIREVDKIKAKMGDKKKRLSWQERESILNKVVRHLAITFVAAVDHHSIRLIVESYVMDARKIDELLETGKFKWSEQESKVMADKEVWETVSPYYALCCNESFPYYKGLKSLCYNLRINY